MEEEIALISNKAFATKLVRKGLVVRWYLHGGSEFRQECVPLQFIHSSSDIKAPGDKGTLIVLSLWAETKCITPLKTYYEDS